MTAPQNAKITFISAGAGSGKTHRLTNILYRELSAKRVRPAGVIATTFTKKAATELRERVRSHLLNKGDFTLANAMGEARIGTVNGVCGQLLLRFAFEAGMSTDQQVLEETQVSLLLARAIDAVMDGPTMGEFLALAHRLGLDESTQKDADSGWKKDLQALVNQIRSNDIPLDRVTGFAKQNADSLLSHFPKPTKDDLNELVEREIQRALPHIEQAAAEGNKKNTNEYLADLRDFQRSLVAGRATWGAWVKLSKAAPEKALLDVTAPIAEAAARVSEHRGLHEDITRYLDAMFGMAARALGIYAETKRELGVLDFVDQEHLLLGLLDHPEVELVLADELDLLVVDEFQDTSPIQLALFLKLARFAKQVYWVGDIKQAIYGFRGSDTELMQAILRALPALGGQKEVLNHSWRSRAELVELVNAVFTHAFSDSLPEDEVKLDATRKETLPGAPMANWMLQGKNAAQEMTALACGIRRLIESRYQVTDKGAAATRDIRFGDIAVLSKTNDGVAAIVKAFRQQGIPCATAQSGLLATPEATLALACLRRLNDPGDTIATAEIVSLADCEEPEVWVADRLRYLASGADSNAWLEHDTAERNAHPLLAAIAAMRANLPLLAPREALYSVMAACNLAANVVRWQGDSQVARVRLANLEALLDLATQYEDICRSGQRVASISGLIIWLTELAAADKDLLAQPAVDAVKVMTHYAAKGLEWPAVILMDLAKPLKDRLWSISAQSGADFDVHAPLKDRFIRYWPWPFGAQQKVNVGETIAQSPIGLEFRKVAVEEEKRLLYVSMTRARDLMILARSSRKPTGEWIDCVGAPWLLPGDGAADVTLPSGQTVKADRWALDVAEDDAKLSSADGQLYWFASASRSKRLPLSFNPSGAESIPATVLETCRIGDRITVRNGTDMTALGNAVHACLALSYADPSRLIDASEVERLLHGFGLVGSAVATDVVRQIEVFHQWHERRWPAATVHAEYPIQTVLATGQTLNGRLDLLLDTPDGWVLIDHKASQLAADHWDAVANEYAAQLHAYANAVAKASGRPVSEAWLFLPVAGGAVRIAV